ncbi:transposable element Tc1 transposase [Trichonephila clavipes]|nr:transposable element Tc1 transposase [Trichonephila clavipes]
MTVHRRLIERNLCSHRPLCHSCMHTAKPHYSGAWLDQVGIMMIGDESRFQLCPDDHRRRVWRRPGQRADPAFTIAHHTGPQPGVMVWGATSFDSRTPLVTIRGTLSAQRFVDHILRTVLLPFLLQYLGLIFQQDNARPYTVRVVMICITAC